MLIAESSLKHEWILGRQEDRSEIAACKSGSLIFHVFNRGRIPSVAQFPSLKWQLYTFCSQGYVGKITMTEIAAWNKKSSKRCIPGNGSRLNRFLKVSFDWADLVELRVPQGLNDVRFSDVHFKDLVEGVLLEEDQFAGLLATVHRSPSHNHLVVGRSGH